MGAAGPEWILSSFTLDNMIGQVAGIYEKAFAEHGARQKAT